jgi:hypothetical protein
MLWVVMEFPTCLTDGDGSAADMMGMFFPGCGVVLFLFRCVLVWKVSWLWWWWRWWTEVMFFLVWSLVLARPKGWSM